MKRLVLLNLMNTLYGMNLHNPKKMCDQKLLLVLEQLSMDCDHRQIINREYFCNLFQVQYSIRIRSRSRAGVSDWSETISTSTREASGASEAYTDGSGRDSGRESRKN